MEPLSSLEQLYAEGRLSLRALKCCRQARLQTVRDVALYHRDDPRYTTLAGCGKLTRRELNALIKEAYGRLALTKAQLEEQAAALATEGSWQERWESAAAAARSEVPAADIPEGSVAAEWLEEGTLTASDVAFLRKCEAYAQLVRARRGVPHSTADVALHQWFLKQWNAQSSLPPHRKQLFEELVERVS